MTNINCTNCGTMILKNVGNNATVFVDELLCDECLIKHDEYMWDQATLDYATKVEED